MPAGIHYIRQLLDGNTTLATVYFKTHVGLHKSLCIWQKHKHTLCTRTVCYWNHESFKYLWSNTDHLEFLHILNRNYRVAFYISSNSHHVFPIRAAVCRCSYLLQYINFKETEFFFSLNKHLWDLPCSWDLAIEVSPLTCSATRCRRKQTPWSAQNTCLKHLQAAKSAI